MSKVVKFGGSSLASAEQFKKVGDIIRAEADRKYVVPSAPGKRNSKDTKVTDMLYGCYALAEAGKNFDKELAQIKERYEEIIKGLRMNFEGECTEVGMYLAMARVAHREGYPEIGMYYEKAAYEEAEHAAKFAELLGEVVTTSTKKNLELRVDAENGATMGKFELAKRAKELNLDAIHDTVHEMARDEARHGKAFEGLLKRYFK